MEWTAKTEGCDAGWFEVVTSDARRNPDWIAFSGSHSSLTRSTLLGEAVRPSARLPKTAHHRTLASQRPRMGRRADREGDHARKSCCAAKIGAALHLPYS